MAVQTDSQGYNWGTGEKPETVSIDDFEIAEGPVSGKSVEEIEQEAAERQFKSPPPGDHLFRIKGFFEDPKPIQRTLFVNGAEEVYYSHQVAPRFEMVDDPTCSIIDFFDLPPTPENGLNAYQNGGKTAESSAIGFHAAKFDHFIQRLGFPYPKGGNLPPAARKLRNWIGMEIICTIEQQKQVDSKIDPSTGLPFPPRMGIKLFSYRPAEAEDSGAVPASPVAATAPKAPPQRPVAPPANPAPQRPVAPPAPAPAPRPAPAAPAKAKNPALKRL